MAKQGFRVMDSDLHVVEPRNLWEDYLDPKFRGRITPVPDTQGQMRAQVDGKVLPPYVDRPERQRAWSLRMRRPGWERVRRGTPPKDVLEAMDVEGIDVGILFRTWATQAIKPSELFRRQCFVSVEPEEELAKYVVAELGDENLVLSTDWPHDDSRFPHAIDGFLGMPDLSKDSKRKILWDNCARLYSL